MVHSIASICCQHWNIPIEAIISALGTMQKMKFCLQTNHGDSDECCSGIEQGLPFQGRCQGNGGAPALWIAVSIILVCVLCEHEHVTEWTSAISKTVTMLISFLFIDDTPVVLRWRSTLVDLNIGVSMECHW
jgi:phosphatidylserine synthase